MEYEGMALEIAHFIRGRKREKIEKLIKEIVKSIDLKKSELPDEEQKNLTKLINNEITDIKIDEVVCNLQVEFEKNCHIWNLSNNSGACELWNNRLQNEKSKWIEIQSSEDFKVENLIREINKFTADSINEYINKELVIDEIKFRTKRSIDIYLDTFDVADKFSRITVILTKYALDEFVHELEGKKETWQKTQNEETQRFDFSTWLDWASDNAKNVNFATHPIKLTHSSIKGASSFYAKTSTRVTPYLTTDSLAEKQIDIAYSNNALAPIAKFLQLQYQGETVADQIIAEKMTAFRNFTENDEQLESWKDKFSDAFIVNSPSSHRYAKQIYFPLGDQYHLLSPLVSSTLTQSLYDRLSEVYGDEAKEIRKRKREEKYHHKIALSYPEIAILKITASNHGNASPLNGKRGGRSMLLPCTPPEWRSSLKPPVYASSIFYDEFNRRAWRLAKELQNYLLKIQANDSNKKIRDHIKHTTLQIIDILLIYAAEVQNLTEHAGWSASASELKESQKLWLDPDRQDESFQSQRQQDDWQDQICRDFGLWLNHKLKHEKMTFAKIQSDHWAKLLKPCLKEFEWDREAMA